MKKMWIWTNSKKQGETATIEYNNVLDQYKTIHHIEHGKLTYTNHFKSLRGAKSSMSRYVGYKTEWEEVSLN